MFRPNISHPIYALAKRMQDLNSEIENNGNFIIGKIRTLNQNNNKNENKRPVI